MRASIASELARWRVPLGFLFGIAVLVLATPRDTPLVVGGAVAVVGEALRVWAAGHLEKSREVTKSGPYRFTRHPLYLGSAVMGIGLAIAANSIAVAAIVAVYLTATLTAAIRSEEAFLRGRFGREYDAYAAGAACDVERRFSVERALRNREYRAVVGLAVAFLVLVLKLRW
jgi:protein-S-isoprenylcysteine O-methyltransferase Ste14